MTDKPRLIALARQPGRVPMAVRVPDRDSPRQVGFPFEVTEQQWREIAESD